MNHWKKLLDIAVSGDVLASHLPPHVRFLSLPQLTSWSDKCVEITWQANEEVHQGSGVVFGGYIAALADYIAGSAMLTVLEGDKGFATRRLTTEFKQPITTGEVKIVATVTQETAHGAQVQVSFFNAKGRICAAALAEQVYLA